MSTNEQFGIPIGEWNKLYLVFGARGQGKSTYCIEEAIRIGHPAGAIIIGHSLGARLPRVLPDGTHVQIEFHESIERLARGIRRHPQRIHILAKGEADELMRFARDLSLSLRKKAWRERNGWLSPFNSLRDMSGYYAPPILVIIDEGVALTMNLGKTSGRNEDARYFREAMYSARHEHIGYMLQIQDPNALGPAVMTQATNYVCFRIEHQYALNALRAAGATDEDLEEIPTLGIGEYIEWGQGVEHGA